MAKLRSVLARHYGALQVVVVVAGVEVYELARHLMVPNWEVAEAHAREIVSWERYAHIEWESWLQQTFLRVPELVRAMNVFYFVGHFVLTIVVTGNHFVFDAIAGVAVMALGFWLSETLFEHRAAMLRAASRGGAVR